MGFLSPPKPPSAQAMANAQQEVNRDTTRMQVAANRVNQTDPFGGSLEWSQRGTDPYGNPLWQKDTRLGETGQQYAQGLAGLGQSYFEGAQGLLGQNPDFSSNAAFDRAYGLATANLEPRFERSRAAMENRLRNQGLDPTSEAYKSAANDLALQQNEARNSLVSGLQGQMFNQGLQADQQNINRLSALTQPGIQMSNQVLNPGVGPVQAVSTGITPNMSQNMMNAHNAEMQGYSSMMSGLGGLAGLGLKAFSGGLF